LKLLENLKGLTHLGILLFDKEGALKPLENLKGLTHLDIAFLNTGNDFKRLKRESEVADLKSLEKLPGLTNLSFSPRSKKDFMQLGSLKGLTHLDLDFLSDPTSLEYLKELTHLSIDYLPSELSDLSPLGAMKKLEKLSISSSIGVQRLSIKKIPDSLVHLSF